LLGAAALWSVGLVVAAIVAPAYTSTSVSSPSASRVAAHPTASLAQVYTHTAATLVQVNGFKALAPVGLPLLATVVVSLTLGRRRRRAKSGAGPLAWTVTVLVAGAALLGMLSIGPFIVPVAVLLGVTCGRSSGGHAGQLHPATAGVEQQVRHLNPF
jgi:uncharacterized membrane protein YhaH (DUF805 family)